MEFVRKSVRAIGRCAIKINSASEKCVNVLLDLIKGKAGVNHIVQEAIIVIKVSNVVSNFRIFSASIP